MNRREFMWGAGAASMALPSWATAAESRPFRIYMALWRGREDAARGFQDYLVARGVKHELIIRDAAQDASRLPGFVEEARRLAVDLVFTWGTTVTTEMLGTYDGADPARHLTDIPVVFAIVSHPVASRIVPDYESSGRNVTGGRYLMSSAAQINLMQAYRPFRRLGLVYNQAEENSRIAVRELEQAAAKEDIEVVALPVAVGADGKPRRESIPPLVAELAKRRVEFCYIPPDTFINVNCSLLTASALKHRLPTFAAAEAPVRTGGALFGGVYEYYAVGQMAGYKAEQILVKKVHPRSIPIDQGKKLTILLNMKVAKELDIYPPLGLATITEVVS